MERFYQQVEGSHWPFAYAMLSRRYRASLDQDRFVAQYTATGAKERGGAARARRFEETATLAWDGEDWRIDRIVRRDVTPPGTR